MLLQTGYVKRETSWYLANSLQVFCISLCLVIAGCSKNPTGGHDLSMPSAAEKRLQQAAAKTIQSPYRPYFEKKQLQQAAAKTIQSAYRRHLEKKRLQQAEINALPEEYKGFKELLEKIKKIPIDFPEFNSNQECIKKRELNRIQRNLFKFLASEKDQPERLESKEERLKKTKSLSEINKKYIKEFSLIVEPRLSSKEKQLEEELQQYQEKVKALKEKSKWGKEEKKQRKANRNSNKENSKPPALPPIKEEGCEE